LTEAAASITQSFIDRWRGVAVLPGSTELATAQSFVTELCSLLGVASPHHAEDYQFERPVNFMHGDGSSSPGRIDCYKRGAFVLEAKKLKPGRPTAIDAALLAARSQAEGYARALPAAEGRPPFVIVVDVGRVIELYAEFTRSGGTYVPYPDPRSHRITLSDLVRPEIRERLAAVWDNPLSLDPARQSARVTRDIAAQLAEVAKMLEAAGHPPKTVAGFLSRCLFTMFAEDVGLLPKQSFGDLMADHRGKPDVLARQLEFLWTNMDRGEFSPLLGEVLLKFNGKLFKDRTALPLEGAQIDLLISAARADWTQVEPAIFGTLLERALDPAERHALGAHYTPRAYVERLVLPTIMEPLRDDWQNAQTAALVLAEEAQASLIGRAYASESDRQRERDRHLEPARKTVRDFLRALCEVRVLDPACGSGNFLYVALEQMKRLEGEVLNFLDELGDTRGRLDLAGFSVDPHQLLGIELNPRAAAVAEMVLWIGYLQWHYRTRGDVNPPLPVLKDFNNIECRDAVLAYDRVEFETDASGRPVTRWDGKTMKKHPVTGEDVPDDSARMPVEKYINPRAAQWPQADFVVGNPPFIGNKRMRIALGDGYVEALRGSWPNVPETADLVMYWREHAAQLTRGGKLRRFGLITTNSLRQTFNRKLVERHLAEKTPLSLVFAIPDHPWVDSANGAAVRIAMTVGSVTNEAGSLATVLAELPRDEGESDVQLSAIRRGEVHGDLTVGAKVGAAHKLQANAGLCFQGMNLVGKGFRVTRDEVRALGYAIEALPEAIKPHRNARDMMQGGGDCYVIDFFGFTASEAREQHPALYQWLLDRVKPERDHNNRESRRLKWWLFGEPVGKLRHAWRGLPRMILTPETSKHRVFEFQALPFCPDHKLYAVCSADSFVLGVLSSMAHAIWAVRAGGRLGVGNDPTWTNTTCFLPFAFPACGEAQSDRIVNLAEQIDAHRKRHHAQHPDLTLTGMYNVLEKLRANEPLNPKDRTIHEHGLVSVLRELHDDLDRAVFDAYGWNDLAAELVGRPGATTPLPDKPAAQAAAEEELLTRLVKLNAERAAEEARGLVRWLRPEFQRMAIGAETEQTKFEQEAVVAPAPSGAKRPWPKEPAAQAKALSDLLAASPAPLSLDAIASHFTARGRWRERLEPMLDMLVVLGKARHDSAGLQSSYRRPG
jgi:hypothetical protein